MMTQHQGSEDFSGTWFCWHWYPSKDDTGEDMTKNRMRAYRKGTDLVLESEQNEEKSYMFVRLSIDDDLATGTWYETASPTGNFQSATYSGAGQLLVSKDQQEMEGKWAGIGYDHKANKSRIYTGRWKLARQDESTEKEKE
jgi:hypothetical protein